ncbi:MAG: HAMP domain-containing histidine kinase [Anaerolineae bacterium]|nr:HAMP domain-containing histidine kinase [Anaerolineae bacterium]MDW8172163.1 HAMP domain-containing sensor histidine kinase [Anaerolineae bacterium]
MSANEPLSNDAWTSLASSAPARPKAQGQPRRFTLRQRLFASYLFMLAVSLGVISLALLLLFSTQAAPLEQSYQRIAAIAQGLNLRDLIALGGRRRDRLTLSRFVDLMNDFAETRSVRVLWLVEQKGTFSVLHDTSGTFQLNDALAPRMDDYNNPFLQRALRETRQFFGTFHDPDGQEWVFAGVAREAPALRPNQPALLLIAEPRPTRSLQSALSEFGRALLPPIIQAGFIGALVAFGLAFAISRSIARPLKALVEGAEAVARGNYSVRVAEQGAQELRRVAQAFNHMAHEVRSSQEAQRDFVANVSHDLKTPLTSIQGYSQAIIDGAAKDPAQAARIIHDEAARLNRLVVELTDLIRLQSGRLSMHFDRVDLARAARAIAERLAVVAQSKAIDLAVQAPPELPIVGDGDRLAQVITNLLSNALKYTPNGGQVSLRLYAPGEGVELIVRDSGIGIPSEDLPRIFERFYQVDKARGPRRGTGLGLAIVREIVSAHGGRIHAESDGPGRGATFVVWLPKQPPKPSRSA